MGMICENFVKNMQEFPRNSTRSFIKKCVFTGYNTVINRNEGGTS